MLAQYRNAPWFTKTQSIIHNRLTELLGLCLIVLGLGVLLSLISYYPTDPSWSSSSPNAPQNYAGIYGSHIADALLQFLGMSSYLIVPVLWVWGFKLLRDYQLRSWASRLTLTLPMLFFASSAMANLTPHGGWMISSGLGGFLGYIGLATISNSLFATVPLPLITGTMAGVSAVLFLYVIGITGGEWKWVVKTTIPAMIHTLQYGLGVLWAWIKRLFVLARTRSWQNAVAKTPTPKKPKPKRKKSPAKVTKSKTKKSTTPRQTSLALAGTYVPPSLDLLQDGFDTIAPPTKSQLQERADELTQAFADFGVTGTVHNVRPGPVVTLYEFEPKAGTRASKVTALAPDIARTMSAKSVRIATIAGRNVLGIELPNPQRETVGLRELMTTPTFQNTKQKLPMILGKDIGGDAQVVDMATMPHLLIAGTTGSGKSVGLNAMILSLLYRLSPQECRMIMIDPKMLELSVYDDIPHLLTPVVTDSKKAVVALKWAVREMEDRYRAMSKMNVRNIDSYNQKVTDARRKGQTIMRTVQTGFDENGKPVHTEEPMPLDPLPYIVIVVDELADLMIVAGKEIEASIQRLSQMARAAGVHLIMATQRPSVDVITGTIKSNFPSRISFMVSSAINSRTILDEQGAENLLGKGDMLYRPNGGAINRIHGPFVDDAEVTAVCDYLRTLGDPEYVNAVVDEDEQTGGFDTNVLGASLGDTATGNDLYDRAVAIAINDQKASTSYIQRKLKIGYQRAAELIDRMEDEGVISGANHVGRRTILVQKND